MLKFLILLFFSANISSYESNIDVKLLTMQRYTLDFEKEEARFGFDLSGIRLEKKITKDVSAVLFPFFANNNLFNNEAAIKNNYLIWGVYEAYFKADNIAYGINLFRLGLGETPWYKIEKSYYPYRFVAKPLAYRLKPIAIEDTGVYFSKNFFNSKVYLGYHTGEGFSGSKDEDNISAFSITGSFLLFNNDKLNDVSINISINQQTKDIEQSFFNILFGYKYLDTISFSIEYFGAYGQTSQDMIKAFSSFVDLKIRKNLNFFLRHDYTDLSSSIENYYLSGLSTKFFNDTLSFAVSFNIIKPLNKNILTKQLAFNTAYFF